MDELRERTENQPDDMNTDNNQEGRDKEILLKNLEAVRQQVAELQELLNFYVNRLLNLNVSFIIKTFENTFNKTKKARLESIRREQLRLQRQFQYDQVHFLQISRKIPESFLGYLLE